MKRMLEDIKDLSTKKKDKFRWISQPLLDIALVFFWVDEQGQIQDFSYVSQSFWMYNLVLRAAKARGT
jgi:hypothetical protein